MPILARKTGRWRRALAYVARRVYRKAIGDIGHVLNRDGTTISHMIQRIQGQEIDTSEEIVKLVVSLQASVEGRVL
jgi:chromosomal replication initiation ATPase DnaA